MKKIIIYLVLSFQFVSGNSQDFPPPQYVHIEIIGANIMHLIWEEPVRELSSYNIYRNGGLIGNTTDTEYFDTIFFVYSNKYCITAVYVDPDGESVPFCAYDDIPVTLFFPYYEDFEGLTSLLASYALTGNDFWEKSTDDFYSGEQAVLFSSNLMGNMARILTPIFVNYNNDTVDIKVSFWYHHLFEQNNHDDLFFIYESDTGYARIGPLPLSEGWTLFDTVVTVNPSGRQFGFDAECKNGAGVMVDEFSMEIISVGIADHFKYEAVLGQNYPNPCATETSIPFSVPSDGYYNFSLYDIRGLKVKIVFDEYFLRGNHKISIDVNSLENGVYLYRLAGGQTEQAKIMMINK